jgi:hypothetical protein
MLVRFQQAYSTFILKCVVVRDEDPCRLNGSFILKCVVVRGSL